MKSHPASVKLMTNGKFMSLQEASIALKATKRDIMNIVRAKDMSVGLLFGKYTVFTKEQIEKLQILLEEAGRC